MLQTCPLVSISIPAYEMRGVGASFLRQNLTYICDQSYPNLEVVVSDHSVDESVKSVCHEFLDRVSIVYSTYTHRRGSSSANLNNALDLASGEIIKVLMQDDFLVDPSAIASIAEAFISSDAAWLVTGCSFGADARFPRGQMAPVYSDDGIIRGINTIGAPSVLAMSRTGLLRFDEELVWMMDCDYYKRLFDRFGPPCILTAPLVFISQHCDQISSWLPNDIRQSETNCVFNRYAPCTFRE